LPDTKLKLPPFTHKDLDDLQFAAAHADMVGFSFVRKPEHVRRLVRELQNRGGTHLGVLVKIENRAAFERLPRILLAGMQSPPLGVMVARGDLAVELGFERLAEVQEEILWLAEAAHVPVVWATQVLETLAQTGRPSRAEVTDAAVSGRAECVMLNNGPHVVEAVRFLDDVLRRMQRHQRKKRAMLRKLSISELSPVPPRAQSAGTS
jgi:pyruvate kinase